MTSQGFPDITSPEFRACAYEAYSAMRAEGPVTRVAMPYGAEVLLLTGYQDSTEVLTDYQRFKTTPTVVPDGTETPSAPEAVLRLLGGSMASLDPPEHTRVRRLVQSAFTPRFVEGLRPGVQRIADDLVDGILAAGSGPFDLVEAFAVPLPQAVMSETLGIPVADRSRFRTWAELVISLDPTAAQSGAGDMDPTQVMREIEEFISFIEQLIATTRAEPGPGLISRMVHAEEDGERMTDQEILKMVALLVVGGLSTTQHLIGNMVLALFRDPGQRELLRADPSHVTTAVDEMLRFHGPIEIAFPRYAAEDMTIAGCPVRRGEMVIALLAAANRDPDRFADPDRVDVRRRDSARHLAFGRGAHMCLGAALARVEGQVALTTLLSRLPGLRPAVPLDDLGWRPGMTLRGLQELPVVY